MAASEASGAPASEPTSSGPTGSARFPVDGAEDRSASRFRSLFVVGRGGMGSIEVAIETPEDGAERVVALKRMLPSSVLDKRHTEMFLREAKLASMLAHPNVVHATSFGERDGELFLVMEYIEGEPLSRMVAVAQERGLTLALPVVAHVLADICEGLHAAHELRDEAGRPLNVVHRDVSPQNVMVSYEGQAKLLDFGVAKIEALEADGRTKTGEVKGKTAYMSPEQAMGDPIDRRSDLYSVGAVLFEAVSGRKMWGGGTDLEVLRRMALEEPPALESIAPATPAAICRLQRRLVARDPNKRPASALEVATELRTFIASTGTHPDARVVRSLMVGLFADEIERRHAKLRKALEQVAPASVEDLGASLRALPLSDLTPVPATRSGLGSSGSRSRSTWALAVGGAAGVAMAIAVGLFWRRAEPPQAPAVAVTAPPTVRVTPAAPSAPPTAPSSTTAAESPERPGPKATPSTSASQPPRPAAVGTTPKPRSIEKPTLEKPTPSASPSSLPKPPGSLDVDPAPF
jgi:eukaryotic-like serine/threonine-protein kinase